MRGQARHGCAGLPVYRNSNSEGIMMTKLIKVVATSLAAIVAGNAFAQSVPGPHMIIYMAKKSYRNFVPVALSGDKRSIISYPDPHDLMVNGKPATPTYLGKGYYLDNRGIDTNAAFLSISYENYAKLKAPLPAEEMLQLVREKRPITFMCDCGLRSSYPDPVAAAKKMVKNCEVTKKCKVIMKR